MAFEDKHHDIYDTINPLKGTANVARGATVLVTGAGRGIGRAISVAFAQAGAANLVLSARTQSQLDETEKEVHEKSGRSDVKVVKATVDVMDGKQVEKLVKQFVDAGADGGKLILINNAGYVSTTLYTLPGLKLISPRLLTPLTQLEPIKVLGDQDPEEWLKTVRINVDGSFFTVQYLLKELKARRYKGSTHVLNTSSIGSYITMPGLSSYQPSKAFIKCVSPHRSCPNI